MLGVVVYDSIVYNVSSFVLLSLLLALLFLYGKLTADVSFIAVFQFYSSNGIGMGNDVNDNILVVYSSRKHAWSSRSFNIAPYRLGKFCPKRRYRIRLDLATLRE